MPHIVTKEIRFCYGHRLANHPGLCSRAHGHEARVEVSVIGEFLGTRGRADDGMLLDFSHIGKVLQEMAVFFDHTFIVAADDIECLTIFRSVKCRCIANNVMGKLWQVDGFGRIQEFNNGAPTAENFAEWCFYHLSDKINVARVSVLAVRFWETSTSMAEFRRDGVTA